MARFHYDTAGRSLVLADGSEVLVQDGPSEAPTWRLDVGATVVGVASTPAGIVAVTELGRLLRWPVEGGDAVATHELGVPARGLRCDASGRCVVAHAGGAVVVPADAEPISIDLPGTTAAALALDGGVAIGTDRGEVRLFDARGVAVASHAVAGAVHDLSAHPSGAWFVAHGAQVHRIEGGEVAHVTNAPDSMPVKAVECSPDGARVALQVGDEMAIVMLWPSRQTDASLIYGDRAVSGLAFGPDPWIGVGLDHGDGNKLNLVTGALHRTDTHPGREHRRWVVMKSAGTAPAPSPAAAPGAPPAPEPPAGSNDALLAWLGCGAVVLVLALVAFFVLFT